MSSGQANPFESPRVLDLPKKRIHPFRPAHTWALIAIAMLLAVVVADVFFTHSTYRQIGLLERAGAGHFPTVEEVLGSSVRQGAAFLVLFLVLAYVGSGISFLIWFYRAHRNLPALDNRILDYSPISAVVWWFVPIAGLICPCLAMAEIWKGSDPKYIQQPNIRRKCSALVGWWWVLFLLMNLCVNVGSFRSESGFPDPASSIDLLILANWWLLAGSLIGYPAAILAMLVVWRVDANQQKRHELLQSQAALVPSWAAPASEAAGDDFPFVPPADPQPWTPPEDAGEYPRFG